METIVTVPTGLEAIGFSRPTSRLAQEVSVSVSAIVLLLALLLLA